MSQRQGKGASRPDDPPPFVVTEPHLQSGPSITARVQASASGLVSQSVTGPSALFVADSLASSAAEAGKGGTGAGSAGCSTFLHAASSSARNPLHPIYGASEREDFRSQYHVKKNIGFTNDLGFDDFMSGILSAQLVQSHDRVAEIDSATDKATVQPISPVQNSIPDFLESKCIGHFKIGNDGAAVVTLLADPEFSADDTPTDTSIITTEDTANAQAIKIDTYAQAFPPRNQVAVINPLNLLPDFRRPRGGALTARSANSMVATPAHVEGFINEKNQLYFRDRNLQPWLDIVNRYQDDVWGDMLPLVQEAREEAKVANGNFREDAPATRRLRMLLKHLG